MMTTEALPVRMTHDELLLPTLSEMNRVTTTRRVILACLLSSRHPRGSILCSSIVNNSLSQLLVYWFPTVSHLPRYGSLHVSVSGRVVLQVTSLVSSGSPVAPTPAS